MHTRKSWTALAGLKALTAIPPDSKVPSWQPGWDSYTLGMSPFCESRRWQPLSSLHWESQTSELQSHLPSPRAALQSGGSGKQCEKCQAVCEDQAAPPAPSSSHPLLWELCSDSRSSDINQFTLKNPPSNLDMSAFFSLWITSSCDSRWGIYSCCCEWKNHLWEQVLWVKTRLCHTRLLWAAWGGWRLALKSPPASHNCWLLNHWQDGLKRVRSTRCLWPHFFIDNCSQNQMGWFIPEYKYYQALQKPSPEQFQNQDWTELSSAFPASLQECTHSSGCWEQD